MKIGMFIFFFIFQPMNNSDSGGKESDAESVHSAPASDPDSGRGSNEDGDSAERGPIQPDRQYPTHLQSNQGTF